jgi:hypothetical protein
VYDGGVKSSELARAVSEGGNAFGALLCTGALASLRAQGTDAEIAALLADAVRTYGPAFRQVGKLVKGARGVEPALARLEALARGGIDFGRPEAVAEVRAAIREVLSGVGFELPRHAGPGVRCELHGRECPTPGEG